MTRTIMELFAKAHDEARARIIWGEAPHEVEAWLHTQGLTEAQSAALVKTYWQERCAEIRASGLRHIAWGTVFAVAGCCLLWVYLAVREDWSLASVRRPQNTGTFVGLLLIFLGLIEMVNRRENGKELAAWALVFAVGCTLIVVYGGEVSADTLNQFRRRRHGTGVILGFGLLLFGLLQTIHGLIRWVGGRFRGSLTELEDDID